MDIGARGLQAIEYIGASEIFERHCNPFRGIIKNKTEIFSKEEVPGYNSTRPELMQALNEALTTFAPTVVVHFGTKVTDINVENN